MKTVLLLSVVLCVALSIRAATVVPAEAAEVQEENKAVPKSGMDVDSAVTAGRAAALPQARLQFCLDGWQGFGGKCYRLVNHVDSWTGAERYCAGYDGSLASVHSMWDYEFLQRMVKTGGHTLAWIGGFYFQDAWRWEDGSAFNYYNWESGHTSNDFYQCLQLNSQVPVGWSSQDCSTRLPFVCQVNPGC